MSDVIESAFCALRQAVAQTLATPCGDIERLSVLMLARRKELKMSLNDVAKASGFTKSHIWELEQGRSCNPTIAACFGLSKALMLPFEAVCQAALKESLK